MDVKQSITNYTEGLMADKITEKILALMKYPEKIRNIAIAAHIDLLLR